MQESQLKSLAYTWFNPKSPQSGQPTRGFGPVFGDFIGDCNVDYDGDCCDVDWNLHWSICFFVVLKDRRYFSLIQENFSLKNNNATHHCNHSHHYNHHYHHHSNQD